MLFRSQVLAVVNSAVIAPVVKIDSPDPALRVIKRRWADADVYLFFNEGAQVSEHAVTLMTHGRTAARWDAQTGTVTPQKTTFTGGYPVIDLNLPPYETSVIVVR